MTRLKLTPSLAKALRAVRDGKVRAEMTDHGPFHATSVGTTLLRDLWRCKWAQGNSSEPWTLTPAGVEALAQYEREQTQ